MTDFYSDIGRCGYSEPASSSTTEEHTEQPLLIVKRPASCQLPSVTTTANNSSITVEDRLTSCRIVCRSSPLELVCGLFITLIQRLN